MKKCMILAAGLGSRLKEITRHKPKPLVDIGGTHVLGRTLGLLHKAGIEDIAMNIHYHTEQIQKAVADADLPLNIHFFHEPELLETGGGIKNALPFLGDEPFMVINADVLWHEEAFPLLPRLLKTFDPAQMDALLTVVPLGMARAFRTKPGDFFLEPDGRLRPPKEDEKAPYVYACVQIMHPHMVKNHAGKTFTLLPCFLESQAKGRLFGMAYQGPWTDIGTPEGLAIGRTMISEQIQIAC